MFVSSHVTVTPSSASAMAIWLTAVFGPAPCQCFDEEFALAVALMGGGGVDVNPVLTHTIPFERAVEAFEIANDRDHAMKVRSLSNRDAVVGDNNRGTEALGGPAQPLAGARADHLDRSARSANYEGQIG